jgi:hypothetical protein
MTFRSGLLVTSLRRGAGVAEKDDIIETRKRKLKTSQTLPHPLQKPRAKDGHPEMLKAFKSRPERVAHPPDVGMIERGGGLRFALEAFERGMVGGRVLREEFQHHRALEVGVFGLVNDAHSAAAEFFDNAVMRNGPANQGWSFRHGRDILEGQSKTCQSIWQRM